MSQQRELYVAHLHPVFGIIHRSPGYVEHFVASSDSMAEKKVKTYVKNKLIKYKKESQKRDNTSIYPVKIEILSLKKVNVPGFDLKLKSLEKMVDTKSS